MMDAVIGVTIVGVLLAITAASLTFNQRVTRSTAMQRQLANAAETALLELQAGAPLSDPSDPEVGLIVSRLSTGDAPAGLVWVSAEAVANDLSVTNVGLVPLASARDLPSESRGGASESVQRGASR